MKPVKASLRAVFSEAAEIADAAARSAFLDSACEGDAGFRRKVERLLEADSRAGSFLGDRGESHVLDPFSEKPGQKIGRYRLLEPIGKGGCGVVYLAEQEEPVRRRVALKVIKLGMDTQAVVSRFEAERQALAMMDHLNIARVLDAGATETGRPFFVMELVRGIPITQYCEQNGLSIGQRLELFIQVCHAVQHAHQKGIIHRDLKPSNILVAQQDGRPIPKVIDFGVAKATDQQLGTGTTVTHADQFIGTPAYMSPEQVEPGGRDIDTRSDIYSLGIVLYELMTGTPPFDSQQLVDSGLEEMRRVIREVDPPRPSTSITRGQVRRLPGTFTALMRERLAAVRGDVDWIVMKCLEKDRARRYETASGLALDIRRHLDHEPIVARPPTGFYRLQKVVRRHRLAVAAASTILLVMVVAVIVSSRQAYRARRAEREQTILRGIAETQAEESRQRLLRRYVAEGNRLLEQGNPFAALPWLVEALQMEQGDPAREAQQRLRLGLAMQGVPELRLNIFQGKWVQSLAFSPDGSRLATGSNDRSVRVTDLRTGDELFAPLLMRGNDGVGTVHFNHDGSRLLAIDYGGWARVWDGTNGRAITGWIRAPDYRAKLTDDVTRILRPWAAFSPDGKSFVTAWGATAVHLWDASSGKHLRAFRHTAAVYHAAFSPDGARLATSGKDRAVRVWEANTGASLGPPLQHSEMVSSVQFSPDGQRLLTLCGRRSVHLWDWRAAKESVPAMNPGGRTLFAVFSPDGRRILTAGWDRLARLYAAADGRFLKGFEHPAGVVEARFSPDGARLATACYDFYARIWDAEAEHDHPLAVLPQGDETDRVLFSPDGRQLAVAGAGGLARLWHLFPQQPGVRTFAGSESVWAEFDGTTKKFLLTAGSSEGNVRVFDTASGKLLSSMSSPSNFVSRARFSPDGTRVLAHGSDHAVHVFDVATGRPTLPRLVQPGWVSDAGWSPDGRYIATALGEQGARLWDTVTGQLHLTLPLTNADVLVVSFSPDSKYVATGIRVQEVRLFETATGRLALPPIASRLRVRDVLFRPDGKRLVFSSHTRGSPGVVSLRDTATGAPVGLPMLHRDELRNIDFSADGHWLLTSGEDQAARVWNAETGQPASPWLQHADEVHHTQLSPDGEVLATLTSSGELRLWHPRTGEPITPPLAHPHLFRKGRLSFSSDSRQLLVATGADKVWIYDLRAEPADVADLALRAQMLNCKSFDSSGTLVPIDSASLSNAWKQVRKKAGGGNSSEF